MRIAGFEILAHYEEVVVGLQDLLGSHLVGYFSEHAEFDCESNKMKPETTALDDVTPLSIDRTTRRSAFAEHDASYNGG